MRLFDSLGRLCLARGELGRAGEFADRSLERAMATNSRKNVVKAWRPRGEVALANGELDAAEAALERALSAARARALRNPTQLWKTQLAWGRLCAARHRSLNARGAGLAARAVIDRITAGLDDPALRSAFERSPGVRQVDALAATPGD